MSETHIEEVGLYIELDCLLDVKPAMIKLKDENLFYTLLSTGQYQNRVYDNFYPGFKEEYQQRGLKELHNSIVTEMRTFIKEFVDNCEENSKNTPSIKKPIITINTFPYSIKEPRSIVEAVALFTDNKCDIKVINKTLEEIHPKEVKNNYAIVIMYNIWDWLEVHTVNGTLQKNTCPEVSFLSPAIFFKDPPSVPINQYSDIFKNAEYATQRFANLKLLPVSLFSMISKLPVKKEKI